MTFFGGLTSALGGLGGSMSKTFSGLQEQERLKRAEEARETMERARMDQMWDIEQGRVEQMGLNRASDDARAQMDIDAAIQAAKVAQEGREWEQEEARVAANDLEMMRARHVLEQDRQRQQFTTSERVAGETSRTAENVLSRIHAAEGDPATMYFEGEEGVGDDRTVHASIGLSALVESGWNEAEAMRILTENQDYSDDEAYQLIRAGIAFGDMIEKQEGSAMWKDKRELAEEEGGGGGRGGGRGWGGLFSGGSVLTETPTMKQAEAQQVGLSNVLTDLGLETPRTAVTGSAIQQAIGEYRGSERTAAVAELERVTAELEAMLSAGSITREEYNAALKQVNLQLDPDVQDDRMRALHDYRAGPGG